MNWTGRVQIACCIIGILSFFILYCLLSVGYVGWGDFVLFVSGVFCIIGYNIAGKHESDTIDADIRKIKSTDILLKNNAPKTLDLSHNSATDNYVATPPIGKQCWYCKEDPSRPPPSRIDGYVDGDSGNFNHLVCLHNYYRTRKW